MAVLNKALTKQQEGQLTHEEAKAIQVRQQIDEENKNLKVKGTAKQAAEADEKFMELMMQGDKSGKHIKNRGISGADFN
jgi:cell division protein FtsL